MDALNHVVKLPHGPLALVSPRGELLQVVEGIQLIACVMARIRDCKCGTCNLCLIGDYWITFVYADCPQSDHIPEELWSCET